MVIKRPADLKYSDVTDERMYLRRREFIQLGAGLMGAAAGGVFAACGSNALDAAGAAPANALPQTPIANIAKKMVTTDEPVNKFEEITGYNNFYEFGTGKEDPARYAGQMKTSPWTVKIDGLCDKPGDYALDDLIKTADLEERIYRFRCVEAWSMVIPWIGIPLAAVIKRVEPASNARFVEFYTLHDVGQFPQQRSDALAWPYIEGLRLDEAMHPLTILAVGLYGEVLPNQT